jgi:hypothetical protein
MVTSEPRASPSWRRPSARCPNPRFQMLCRSAFSRATSIWTDELVMFTTVHESRYAASFLPGSMPQPEANALMLIGLSAGQICYRTSLRLCMNSVAYRFAWLQHCATHHLDLRVTRCYLATYHDRRIPNIANRVQHSDITHSDLPDFRHLSWRRHGGL